jgi:hypothetical protein
MSQAVNVNGVTIAYPVIGDTEWGAEATNFAVQTAGAFQKLGLSIGTSVNIPSTLDVTGATTLDSTLTVAGTLNVDSGTLYVNPTDNRVGINDSSPSEALDVTGNALISGTLGVTGDVITSIVKASGSGGLTIDSNGGTDVALFGAGGGSGTTLYGGLNGTTATFSGVIYADDDTTANTPVISFTGDTNTGIGRSAADTIDLITGGISRSRISSVGLQSSVVPDLSGSNTSLFPEYKCRAWVNYNGEAGTVRGSGNVTSITKHTTGDYTINFPAMPDINYTVVTGTKMQTNAVGGSRYLGYNASRSITTTTFPIVTVTNDFSALSDSNQIFVAIFR